MNAQEITRGLGGKWHGSYGTARCPAHNDKSPSLTIGTSDAGMVLVCCHAGCSQNEVINALRAQCLWSGEVLPFPPRRREVREDTTNLDYAMRIWREAVPAAGTLAETYLRLGRGVEIPIPGVLRFHPSLLHSPTKVRRPTMVALVTDSRGEPMGIHRTFLASDGTSKAPVDAPKMMLGSCKGGAIRLSEPGAELAIGEGIETSLSYSQLSGKPVWAAGSATFLEHVIIPAGVQAVIAISDGEEIGLEKARIAARNWKVAGVPKVTIAKPDPGLDFNDVLLGAVSA
jgi:putative DNA primase/helicase